MPRVRYDLTKPHSVRATYRPRPMTLEKLSWIPQTMGMSPPRFIRTLVAEGFSIEAIADKLELSRDTTRLYMASHNITPNPKPTVLVNGTKSQTIAAGRRASQAGLYMVNGEPLIELMERHGHPGGSPVYKRVRRRLGLGWTFEEALADAVKGPRPGGKVSTLARRCDS